MWGAVQEKNQTRKLCCIITAYCETSTGLEESPGRPLCHHRGRWNLPSMLQQRHGQSSPWPPLFSVRYHVTPICFRVGTEVYHAQHKCSIMKHMSLSEIPFDSTTPSRASMSSRTCLASASCSRGSSVAGSQTYVLWGSVIRWRLSIRARLRPRAHGDQCSVAPGWPLLRTVMLPDWPLKSVYLVTPGEQAPGRRIASQTGNSR